jgi:transcriptional regulator with XRE-family HTH domain
MDMSRARRSTGKTRAATTRRSAVPGGRSVAVKQTREDGAPGIPNLGEIIKRFRLQRGESLRDVAEGTGLSASFLSMLERGECDITLSRLAAIANHFDHDVGSLLGYSTRGARPQIIRRRDRVTVNRGRGVDYNVIHVPGTDMELVVARFSPRSGFVDELTHEGIDIGLVIEGRVVVTISDVDYPVEEGEAAIWSGAHRHRVRNDDDRPALLVAVVTERVY